MAQVVPDEVSLQNPVFRSYLFYCSILALKMLFMSILTGAQRFIRKAFVNPEDAKGLKLKPRVDENVERVRRAHLNDLENIPLFFVIGYIYILTDPSQSLAKTLYLTYTVARIIHTIVYAVVVIPQPARAIAFAVGFFITGFMSFKCFFYFF